MKHLLVDLIQKRFSRSSKYNIQPEKRKLGKFGILEEEVVFPISVFSSVLNTDANDIEVEKVETNLYQIPLVSQRYRPNNHLTA